MAVFFISTFARTNPLDQVSNIFDKLALASFTCQVPLEIFGGREYAYGCLGQECSYLFNYLHIGNSAENLSWVIFKIHLKTLKLVQKNVISKIKQQINSKKTSENFMINID